MRQGLRIAAVAVAAASLSGCYVTSDSITFEDGQPPRHEHGWQDWWSYQFIYHPEQQAYYEPYTEVWHWFEDGSWRTGDALPSTLTPEARHAEVVFLQRGDAPWEQHMTTVAVHPNVAPFGPFTHDAWAWSQENGWPGTGGDTEFASVSTDDDRP